MVSNNVVAVILLLVLLFAVYKLYLYPSCFSPLAQLPTAHWSCSTSPLWILWKRYQCQENHAIYAAHLKHGPVVRVGSNEISINAIDDGVRTIYGGGFEKGAWYSIFDNYGVPCTFSTSLSKPHSLRKRMISNVYSKSFLHASRPFAEQAAAILHSRFLPTLTASTSDGQLPHGIDVVSLFYATAMDFITAYQFGLACSTNFIEDIGFREHWLELYHSRKTYTFFAQELPRFSKLLRQFGLYLTPAWVDLANQELEEHIIKMCSKSTKVVEALQAADSDVDEPVVLRALLSGIAKEKASKGSGSLLSSTMLKEPELSVASEMLDHSAAGQETTGITLTYLTWYLSQDVELQRALHQELHTLTNPLKIASERTSEAEYLPDPKELDSLPLLHAIMMETLRVTAAIPGGQPRRTPYPSSKLCGHNIPGGVRVSSAAWTLHRNAKVYPMPEMFDHTRWLEPGGGDILKGQPLKERHKWFWAFGSGGRMCVGSNFAMHEMKLIIAAVYTNFLTHVVNDEGIEQLDGYTCGPSSGRLILRFEPIK